MSSREGSGYVTPVLPATREKAQGDNTTPVILAAKKRIRAALEDELLRIEGEMHVLNESAEQDGDDLNALRPLDKLMEQHKKLTKRLQNLEPDVKPSDPKEAIISADREKRAQSTIDTLNKQLRLDGQVKFTTEEADSLAFPSKLKALANRYAPFFLDLPLATALDMFMRLIEDKLNAPVGFEIRDAVNPKLNIIMNSTNLSAPDIVVGIPSDVGVRLYFLIDIVTRAVFSFHNPLSLVSIEHKFLALLAQLNHDPTRLSVEGIVKLLGYVRFYSYEYKYRLTINQCIDTVIPYQEEEIEKVLIRSYHSFSEDIFSFRTKLFASCLPASLLNVAISAPPEHVQQRLIAVLQATPTTPQPAPTPTIYTATQQTHPPTESAYAMPFVQPPHTQRPQQRRYETQQPPQQPRAYENKRHQSHPYERPQNRPSFGKGELYPPQYGRQPYEERRAGGNFGQSQQGSSKVPSAYTGRERDNWRHTEAIGSMCRSCGLHDHSNPAFCYLYKACVAHPSTVQHTGNQCVSYLQFLRYQNIRPEQATLRTYEEMCSRNSPPRPGGVETQSQYATSSNTTSLGPKRSFRS
jgi:hypothetical protein